MTIKVINSEVKGDTVAIDLFLDRVIIIDNIYDWYGDSLCVATEV